MFGRKHLRVQSSLLAADALLEAARGHYPIDRTATCELVSRHLNDTYSITSSQQSYVLRVYRAGWRSGPEILWELSLVDHLWAAHAPVAAPVPTRAGHWFCIVEAPEGRRHVALFEHAPGKTCSGDAVTPERARGYGRGMAAIHLRTDTFETAYPRFELDLDHLLLRPLSALEPRLAARPQDLQYLRDLAQRLRDAIVELDSQGLARGICHGDLNGLNAHIDDKGEFTFFDFDCAGPGWRAYDLACYRRGLLHERRRADADERWRAFLEGYRELKGLPRVDEAAVPPFVAAREVWSMGLHASIVADHGSGLVDDHYFDRSLGFLRAWDKEMLT